MKVSGVANNNLSASFQRLIDHHGAGDTDRASSTYRVPVDSYRDPERWNLEIDRLFRRGPVAVALSAEIRDPHSYRALCAVGQPIVVIRGVDGLARTFLNVCRHRGAELVAEGSGTARRLTCPYHGWSYSAEGTLVQVASAKSFDDDTPQHRDLVALPTTERHGFVWACLDPHAAVDLEGLLGDYAEELDTMGLEDWNVYRQWTLDGPNWKVCIDGYLEGYHFAALHRDTVNQSTHSNLAVVDQWGPHQRLLFALRSIGSLVDVHPEEWIPERHVAPVHIVFPNTAVAAGWSNIALVSQVLPTAPDRSVTVQTILCRKELGTEKQRAEAEASADFYFHVVKNEDYATAAGVQRGLHSGANQEFIFGRNEPALQHFHRVLDERVGTQDGPR